MKLKQKGDDAFISVKNLTVRMTWSTAADFDIAALYRTHQGQYGLVYFGDLGDLKKFPYIALNKDEGVGDMAGSKQEEMHIAQLQEMKQVWIFCWDYNMVKTGQRARFQDSDVTLNISDEQGNTLSVEIDTGEEGNVCCLAMIDNSSGTGAMLINASRAATLHKLERLEQLVEIAV